MGTYRILGAVVRRTLAARVTALGDLLKFFDQFENARDLMVLFQKIVKLVGLAGSALFLLRRFNGSLESVPKSRAIFGLGLPEHPTSCAALSLLRGHCLEFLLLFPVH